MKKTFLSLIFILIASASIKAQIKEGSITYDMKIEGLPPEQLAMMGDMESKTTFKNGKSLVEVKSILFNQQMVSDENGTVMLMDQMGSKIAMKQTKSELDQLTQSNDKSNEPKIEYRNEKKSIAGYECKKAIVTVIDEDKVENKIEIWYSDAFENPNKNQENGQNIIRDIKGLPFEYSTTMGPMSIKMVAKEVSTAKVSDTVFNLSTEGYQMMTTEELKAMSGGK
jgi:hypothetical protein